MVSNRLRITLAYTSSSNVYRAQLRQWLCRLVLASDTLVAYLAQDGSEAASLRRLLGLRPILGELSTRELRKRVASTSAALRVEAERASAPLFRNVDLLCSFIKLSAAERDVLTFGSLLAVNQTLRTAIAQHCDVTTEFAIEFLAVILNHPVREIRSALRADGPLLMSGLVAIRDDMWSLESKLTLKTGLALALLDQHEDAEPLLRPFFAKSRQPRTTVEDFPHHREEVVVLCGYLQAAIAARSSGVNVVLYGPPGTGKTELACAIGAHIDAPIYEVQSNDSNGDAASPGDRVSSYQLCQLFLNQLGRGLVLFDEMEDLFPVGGLFDPRPQVGKSWANRMLEENVVPTIWVANVVSHIDPAHLRRFDYSLCVDIPPRSVRRRVLERATAGLGLKKETVDGLAANRGLTPAIAQKIGKVVTTLRQHDAFDPDRVASLIADSSLELQEGAARRRAYTARTVVDLSAFNTSIPSAALLKQLGAIEGPLAVCLYGPSGTGKTCLVQMLASSTDRELVSLTGSDFLDPYVGGTEARIAQAFREAARSRAMLFVDEADSVLAGRSLASHSWEVTKVNEMLVQMERFPGLFVCATNHVHLLDEAVTRRFGLKVEFRYLTLEQASSQLRARYPVFDVETRTAQQRLRTLECLTPGDFAAADQHKAVVDPTLPARAYLDLLEAELLSKGLFRSRFGFSV